MPNPTDLLTTVAALFWTLQGDSLSARATFTVERCERHLSVLLGTQIVPREVFLFYDEFSQSCPRDEIYARPSIYKGQPFLSF